MEKIKLFYSPMKDKKIIDVQDRSEYEISHIPDL